jgi:hypothetical protein
MEGLEMTEPSEAAMKFRKTALIEAAQWFKNGDHPKDYTAEREGLENGKFRTWSGEEAEAKGWEGDIVRYFRHPGIPGDRECNHCGDTMHRHGWIDTLEGGHIVCPGDWIATGVQGEHWPIKPDIFASTYEPANRAMVAGEPGAALCDDGFCDHAAFPHICINPAPTAATDVAELVEALERAAKVFAHYADTHRAKGTPDGQQKSAVNLAHSMDMGEAAAKARALLARLGRVD